MAPVAGQASVPTGMYYMYRFDSGPSLLLFPKTYKSTYAALGQNMAEHVPLRRVEPAAYRVHFERGGHLDMLYDQQKMVEQLEAVEPGAGGCTAFYTFIPLKPTWQLYVPSPLSPLSVSSVLPWCSIGTSDGQNVASQALHLPCV